MKFFKSLKGKITIIVALTIVVTGTVVLLFGYFIARSILREQVFMSMDSVVANAEGSVRTNIDTLAHKAELLSSSEELAGDLDVYLSGAGDGDQLLAGISDQLDRACQADPDVVSVSVTSPDGEFVERYPHEEAAEPGGLTHRLIDPVADGGVGIDYDVEDGELLLTVASAVLSPTTGDVIGALVVASRSEDLQRELSGTPGLGTQGTVMLSKVRGDHVQVLTWPAGVVPGDGMWQEKAWDLEDDLPMVLSAIGGKGEGEMTPPEGERVVYSYDHLPGMGWGVTAATESADAFAPISRLRNVMIIVVVVLLFGGCALSYMIARSIARPLEELQQGVKALGGGKLSTRVTISDGVEVTALADEFNRMAVRLNDLYENLERKVEERTTELREANLRLQELDHLKSEFVSIASHELRSPLASMKMGVSTVVNEMVGPLSDEQKVMLTIANRNIDRLTRLTSEILDLTKIEAGQLDLETGKCDLVELIGEVVEANKPQAEHLGLELEVTAGVTPAYALVDHDRIYQVIQNLVGNSLKFTEEGGVTVSVDRQDGYLVVCVEDTGLGISAEVLPTIFEKFSQAHAETRSEIQGTGLGLAICKGIIEAHGGEITVESEPGRGTRFCFKLPAGEQDARQEEDTDS